MTDPKPTRTPVRLVDEGYVAPEKPSALQMRDAEIAQAKRMARADERAKLLPSIMAQAEIVAEASKQTLQDAHTAEIARLDERWAREERKHAIGNRWRGRFEAAIIVGSLAMIGLAAYTNAIIAPTFDAARESRVQDDVLRTLQRPPTTNEPRSESAP